MRNQEVHSVDESSEPAARCCYLHKMRLWLQCRLQTDSTEHGISQALGCTSGNFSYAHRALEKAVWRTCITGGSNKDQAHTGGNVRSWSSKLSIKTSMRNDNCANVAKKFVSTLSDRSHRMSDTVTPLQPGDSSIPSRVRQTSLWITCLSSF